MGRGAYSSSNNVWSAKIAAYRRTSCKIFKSSSLCLVFFVCVGLLYLLFYFFFNIFYGYLCNLLPHIACKNLLHSRGFTLTPIFQVPRHILVTSRKERLWGNLTRSRLFWNAHHIRYFSLTHAAQAPFQTWLYVAFSACIYCSWICLEMQFPKDSNHNKF